MDLGERAKRLYTRSLDLMAEETINVKIKEYSDMEANAAWDKIKQKDIADNYADNLDERDIYRRFFAECVEAGRKYQEEADKVSIDQNALANYISIAKIPCRFAACTLGFFLGSCFGTEISMDIYGFIGGAGAGIGGGAVAGHHIGKFFGKRKYRKGFLKGIKEIKEQALSDLMDA